jgi:hypothetical protein
MDNMLLVRMKQLRRELLEELRLLPGGKQLVIRARAAVVLLQRVVMVIYTLQKTVMSTKTAMAVGKSTTMAAGILPTLLLLTQETIAEVEIFQNHREIK